MNCDQVRDNIDAYAIGALEPDEAAALERHLLSCDAHADAVLARAAAVALAGAADDVAPPAGFEDRIRERMLARAGRPADRGRRAPLPGWAYAVAAVLVLAIGGLTAWNVALLADDSGAARAYTHTYTDGDGRALRLSGDHGEPEFTVAFAGLESRPASEVYELWVIRDQEWLSVGRFNTADDGSWTGDFSFGFVEGDVLCVTVQSASDEDEPFGVPLIWSPL